MAAPHLRNCLIFLPAIHALEPGNGSWLTVERRFPFAEFSVLMEYALVPQAILAREEFPCDSSGIYPAKQGRSPWQKTKRELARKILIVSEWTAGENIITGW
jgi:hypothetical protein